MKKIINWFRSNFDLIFRAICCVLAMYYLLTFLGKDIKTFNLLETPIGELKLKYFVHLIMGICLFMSLPSNKKS